MYNLFEGIDMVEDSMQDEDIIEEVKGEEEDQAIAIKVDGKLYAYPADFTLEVLYSKLKSGEIVVPPFQRKYVWKIEGASKLIESFMRTLPIPPVYLFKTPNETLWIVDGHQRLMTVRRFFEKKWEADQEFRLILDEKSEFNSKTYEDLNTTEQRKLKNAVLRAVIVEPRSGQSDEALYDMFERLNTGGALLKPQEIRNCVYHGRLNDTFHDLNKLDEWRKIIGTENEDKRQRDVELILRGLALYNIGVGKNVKGGVLAYKPSLKSFLNDFMKVYQNPDEEWLKEMQTLFSNTIKNVVKTLGERPFHLRRAMNAATFDAVFVAYARNSSTIPSEIKRKYEKLKSDSKFRDYTEERPTGEGSVNGRIKIAEKILFGR